MDFVASWLEQPFVAEAIVAFKTDHDMIEHADTYYIANFLEPSGDFDIFLTGRGIAAGMIVDKYNGGCGFADDRIVDFSRVDQRCGERPFGNFHFADFSVLIVQKHDVKEFPLFLPETIGEMSKDIFR